MRPKLLIPVIRDVLREEGVAEEEWEKVIRKVVTELERIYGKLSDESAARRLTRSVTRRPDLWGEKKFWVDRKIKIYREPLAFQKVSPKERKQTQARWKKNFKANYLQWPDPSLKTRFVLQVHIRRRNFHNDFRVQITPKKAVGFSVRGDELVPILDGNGEFSLTPISKVKELKPPLKTIGYDGSDFVWTEVKSIVAHPFTGKLIKTIQKHGQVTTTPSHSLMDREGRYFKPEDKHPVKNVQDFPKLNSKESLDFTHLAKEIDDPKLDLLRYLYENAQSGPFGERIFSQSLRKVSEKLGWNEETCRKNMQELEGKGVIELQSSGNTNVWKLKERDSFDCPCTLDDGILFATSSNQSRKFRSRNGIKAVYEGEEEIKDLLRILAMYITEGFTSKEGNRYRVGASNQDRSLIQSWKESLSRISTGRVWIGSRSPEDGCIPIQTNNKMLYQFLRRYCGKDTYSKRIPNFVFQLKDDLKRFFISELAKGDGTGKERTKFSYSSSSKQLLSGLCYLLSSLGEKFSIKTTDSTNYGTFSNRQCYQLRCLKENHDPERGKRKIKFEEVEQELVWDLETGTNNFAAGLGGIICHNTITSPFGMPLDKWMKIDKEIREIEWSMFENDLTKSLQNQDLLRENQDPKEIFFSLQGKKTNDEIDRFRDKFYRGLPEKKVGKFREKARPVFVQFWKDELKDWYWKKWTKDFLDWTQKKLIIEKATIPIEWLDIDNDFFPPHTIGAPVQSFGGMFILDKGRVIHGAKKDYFLEFMILGDEFNLLMTLRQFPREQVAETLTEEQAEKLGDEPIIWFTWPGKHYDPYVLRERSVKKDYLPPPGHPAIYPGLVKKVPKDARYWEKKNREEKHKKAVRWAEANVRFYEREDVLDIPNRKELWKLGGEAK